MEDETEAPNPSPPRTKWVFPASRPPPDEADGQPDGGPDGEGDEEPRQKRAGVWKSGEAGPPMVLCSLAPDDAAELCAQLEAHGIPCNAVPRAGAGGEAGDTGEAGESDEPHQVDVIVAEADLPSATDLLEGARPNEREEDEESERALAEYQIKNWVCARCHLRTLHSLPLPMWLRLLRGGSLVVLGLFLVTLFGMRRTPFMPGLLGDKGVFGALLVGAVVACILVSIKRQKVCTKCGWRSDG